MKIMENEVDLTVVVPMKDEKENVEELAERLIAVLDDLGVSYEVLLVDDGSSDDTFGEVRRLHRKHRSLGGIKLSKNYGQTIATRAGIEHSRGKVIITMDGDLEHSPEDIPRLLEMINQGYDVVSTWRHDRWKERFGKRVPSRISNFLARLMTEVPAHDFGSGFKAYKRDALQDIPLYGSFHRYVLALVLYGRDYRFGEVKIDYRSRRRGRTKYSAKRLVKGVIDLTYISFYVRLRKNRPRALKYLKKIGALYYGKNAVEGKKIYEIEEFLHPIPKRTR